jgi:hypothetical protein
MISLLKKRHADSHGPWVFPSTRGMLRDPDNTRKRVRDVVAGSEWQGPHPHAFRHLVATRLDKTGLSAREIADYLGHERISMTQDVSVTHQSTGANASVALDAFGPEAWGKRGADHEGSERPPAHLRPSAPGRTRTCDLEIRSLPSAVN